MAGGEGLAEEREGSREEAGRGSGGYDGGKMRRATAAVSAAAYTGSGQG